MEDLNIIYSVFRTHRYVGHVKSSLTFKYTGKKARLGLSDQRHCIKQPQQISDNNQYFMIRLFILLIIFSRHLSHNYSWVKNRQYKLSMKEQSYDLIFIHNRYSAFSNPDIFQGKKAYFHHLSGYFLFSCKLLCFDSIYLTFFKISVAYYYFFYALQFSVLPHRPPALLVYPECSDR